MSQTVSERKESQGYESWMNMVMLRLSNIFQAPLFLRGKDEIVVGTAT